MKELSKTRLPSPLLNSSSTQQLFVESRSWQELLEIVDSLEQRSRPVQEDPDWIFPEREIGGE